MSDSTMAVTVDAAELRRAIMFAAQAVERRNFIPVLGMVHLSAGAGRLTVTGTDMDVECQMRVEAECAAPFALCAGPKALAAIAGFGGRVTLTKADDVLTVEGDGVRARFNSLCPPGDFPFMGDDRFMAGDGEAAAASIPEAVLHQALDDCIPAISTEETRYYLTGIYLHAKGDGLLRAVATDGHRLALRCTDVPFVGLDGIMRTKAVKILHRALTKGGNRSIRISGAGIYREIAPSDGAWRVRAKMIDGTFPDYLRIIPKAGDTISVPVTLEQIRRVSALGRSSLHLSTYVAFDPDAGTLSARNLDVGEIETPLPGGRGARFGMNLRYITDALRRHGTVRLDSAGPGEPFRGVTEDPGLTLIIMPARV